MGMKMVPRVWIRRQYIIHLSLQPGSNLHFGRESDKAGGYGWNKKRRRRDLLASTDAALGRLNEKLPQPLKVFEIFKLGLTLDHDRSFFYLYDQVQSSLARCRGAMAWTFLPVKKRHI